MFWIYPHPSNSYHQMIGFLNNWRMLGKLRETCPDNITESLFALTFRALGLKPLMAWGANYQRWKGTLNRRDILLRHYSMMLCLKTILRKYMDILFVFIVRGAPSELVKRSIAINSTRTSSCAWREQSSLNYQRAVRNAQLLLMSRWTMQVYHI